MLLNAAIFYALLYLTKCYEACDIYFSILYNDYVQYLIINNLLVMSVLAPDINKTHLIVYLTDQRGVFRELNWKGYIQFMC